MGGGHNPPRPEVLEPPRPSRKGRHFAQTPPNPSRQLKSDPPAKCDPPYFIMESGVQTGR
eukprot:1274437-Pyramimonas_sp.AAC.1